MHAYMKVKSTTVDLLDTMKANKWLITNSSHCLNLMLVLRDVVWFTLSDIQLKLGKVSRPLLHSQYLL